MEDQVHAPPDHSHAADIGLLADAFRTHGFAAARVQEVITEAGSGLAALPLVARMLEAGDPLGVLIALFVHGADVAVADADAALAPLGLSGAERIGVVVVDGDAVTATVRIVPFGVLLLASDRVEQPFRDFVMAAAGSTRTLASLTIRRPVKAALDLGTGTGVHAFLASAHAEIVTAVDVNPRALAYARFNACLNNIANVEFLEGSWYEPVAGRTFDLIVSNPPFVIVPDGEFLFRDGCEGGVGDAVSRTLVQATPKHLTDGGVAQFLVNWVHDPDGSWSDPIHGWVENSGCDAWILRGASDDPSRYAVMWNRHLSGEPAKHAATLERWLSWMEAQGIGAIGFGLLTTRRHAGTTWFRADELPDNPAPAAGEQLASTLDAHDVIGRLGQLSDLLHTKPITNPEHNLEQRLSFGDGRYDVEAARVRLRAPLAFTAEVDVFSATLLTLLDGARTLAEAANIASAVLDEPPADLHVLAANLVGSMLVMGLVQIPSAGRTITGV